MNKETIESAIFGVVVGDAVGVPYEFSGIGLLKENPVKDMEGYGSHNKPKGTWSDDSSMTLALLDSLSSNEISYDDIMKKFIEWYENDGYTSDGSVFDYGKTTEYALINYMNGKNPLSCGLKGIRDNGNGSLMRTIPITLYLNIKNTPMDKQIEIVSNVSSLTHAHPISTISCNIYNILVQEILNNPGEKFNTLIKNSLEKSREYFGDNEYFEEFDRLYDEEFYNSNDSIERGRGYVVSSLEVALYSCYNTSSYKEAVLKAVNFAGDTDTNGAITGGIAGLYYGLDSIPEEWRNSIVNKELVYDLCQKFYDNVE